MKKLLIANVLAGLFTVSAILFLMSNTVVISGPSRGIGITILH